MRWILRPSDPQCTEERFAGGKGASLARLVRLGARVPPFLMISADAYRSLKDQEPGEAFVSELKSALLELDTSEGISVRSSAIGEDAADSSFAGLYHTSLDVKDFDAVLQAIRTCWASYEAPAAKQYRDERRLPSDGAMAVVLQQMIHGEWSGVCFTAHPVKLALSEGLINAVPGLGESLVSGEVNPEEITIGVKDGQVLDRRGASDRPLPDAAIGAVWKMSADLSERLHFPQDVEWSWKGNALYILQSRPVTTIADVFYSRYLEPWQGDPHADPDNPKRTWSRMLADETWVSPISPLFYNVHNSTPGRVAFIRIHGDTSPLPPDLFKYHRATAYVDVRLIHRMYEFQPRMARIRGVLNFLPRTMQGDLRNAPWRWYGRLRRILTYEFSDRQMRSFANNYRYVQAQWPAYVEKSNRWLDIDLDTLSLDELKAHQAAVQKEMVAVGPPCAIAVLSHASDLHLLLTGLLERWCRHTGLDGENLYAKISSGLSGSETLRENETLWEIAAQIRELGTTTVEAARSLDWKTFKALLEGEDSESLMQPSAAQGRRAEVVTSLDWQRSALRLVSTFERFWREHRHLGSSYKDLIWPRWGDDIDLCFGMVKGYVESAAERPSLIHARSATSRREAQKEILAGLRGPLASMRRKILRKLFRYNEHYMAVRDNHRFYVDRNWYEVRRIYRSYGARLVTSGILTSRDEVFFLGMKEVEAALEGKISADEAARRVRTRRQVWQTTLREQGPKFLQGWAPFEESVLARGSKPETQLQGIAASPGSAIGTARIVYDVSGLGAVKDGEILVTRQTDPSWTAVFGRISGLVLETGGVLSHGTSLCREYGLPCVTAVERATVRIPDGSRIQLIGSAGTVGILEPIQHAH